jgi:very-short-patch-repair endonuclease
MKPVVVATITELAGRQHGAVSVKQLRAAGATARAQRAAVIAGWLERVESRVFVLAGSPDTWHRRLKVGLLALDGRGWISHEAAACLHGFDRALHGAVEFTVPRASRSLSCSGTVHTTEVIGRLDVVTVDGLRCSSATRTVIDLAHGRVPMVRLEAAIDSAVRLGLSAPVVLERRLADVRGPGRWGARALDEALIDSGGESMLERRFMELMRTAHLPRPRTQAVQRRGPQHVARVDFLFDPYPLVVEVTGRRGHSTPAERDRDAQRRNELIDLGLRVYEYTWTHVTQRPTWVVATMRERLTAVGWAPSPLASSESAGMGPAR